MMHDCWWPAWLVTLPSPTSRKIPDGIMSEPRICDCVLSVDHNAGCLDLGIRNSSDSSSKSGHGIGRATEFTGQQCIMCQR